MNQKLKFGLMALASVAFIVVALIAGGVIPQEKFTELAQQISPPKKPSPEQAPDEAASSKVSKAPQIADPVKSEKQPGGEAAIEEQPKQSLVAKTEEASADEPSFDLLRVEPDGSLVVSGQARQGHIVELLDESGRALGRETVSNGGDFVIIPDQTLPPGDHALKLSVIDPSGKRRVSSQTGILRVPEAGKKDVLALVADDDQPSRIMVKPQIAKNGGSDEKEDTSVALLKTEKSEPEPLEEGPAKIAEDVQDRAEPQGDTGEPETPKETERTPDPVAEKPEAADEIEVAETKQPIPSADVAKPEQVEDSDRSQEVVAVVREEKTTESAQHDNPKERGDTKDGDDTKGNEAAAGILRVLIEAVEIENGKLFIAGAVAPGRTVRLYLDGDALGLARGTPDGRFLLSKSYSLERGEHSVRADVVDESTGSVRARAEVALLHAPDPVELALASENERAQSEEAKEEPEPKTEPAYEETTIEKKIVADEAQSDQKTNAPDGASAAQEADKQNDVQQAEVGNVTRSEKQPAKEQEVVTASKSAIAEPTSEQKRSAPTRPITSEQTVKIAAAPSSIDDQETKESVSAEATTGTASVAKEQNSKRSGEPVADDAGEPFRAKRAPESIIRTGSAVIIKPGDNLWRISRKTYGRGIRYMTIYQANRDQIRDPDRIYIGQIFKLPSAGLDTAVE